MCDKEVALVAFEGLPDEDRKIPEIVSNSTVSLDESGKALRDLTNTQFYPVSHYNNTNGAHGHMHETSNHFRDLWSFRWSRIIGSDNKTNGPDRRVDGILIQDKAHKRIYDTIKSLFDKDADFRFKNDDGSPMLIEVPKDQVEKVKAQLLKKIARGLCTGIAAKDVDDIVIPGHYAYDELVEMCKAGTYKGFVYDIQTGMIPACSLGILTFWTQILPEIGAKPVSDLPWKRAFGLSGKETTKMVVTHIVTSQLDRTGVPAVLSGIKQMLSFELKAATSRVSVGTESRLDGLRDHECNRGRSWQPDCPRIQ